MTLSNKYQLQHRAQLVHDYEDVDSANDIRALVASGDCFITLATRIDDVLQSSNRGVIDQDALEDMVRTLVYLQRNYVVTKK